MQHEPSPAAAVAAALAARAEAVCRQYLPHGRRQGRYWVCGDLDGARGRSLFVRLSGSGKPGGWTDAATGQHGDLLDLIRYRSRAPTLRAALDEARRFLALPLAPDRDPGGLPTGGSDAPYDATEAARRLWRRCRAIDGSHAERYLHARGLARCRFAALRYHPSLRYREGSAVRRFPALVAAVTGDPGSGSGAGGRLLGVHRTWLDPRRPAKAGVALPRKALGRIRGLAVRFGAPVGGLAPLVVGEGIETVLSLVTAVPEIRAAAALSAGSLGAFAPPPGTARLVIARDNDEDGALAAERLARRCAQAGVAATVIVPVGNDFNDDLVDLGAAALRAAVPRRSLLPGCRRKRKAGGRASRPEERREPMDAVINLNREPRLRDAFEHAHVVNNTVLVDRRTKWGNPWRVGRDGTREEVIARYRMELWRHIRAGEIALEELAELDGCWLACWSDPPCHGDVLARAAEWAAGMLADRQDA